MAGESAWGELNEALRDYTPPCAGLSAFTANRRSPAERSECRLTCERCPIADLCGAYATASKVNFGYWAGIDRGSKR